MESDRDLPDAWDVQTPRAVRRGLDRPRLGDEGERAGGSAEPGKPRPLAGADPSEERAEGEVEPLQGVARDVVREAAEALGVVGTPASQLGLLIEVGDRFAAQLSGIPALRRGEVPEEVELEEVMVEGVELVVEGVLEGEEHDAEPSGEAGPERYLRGRREIGVGKVPTERSTVCAVDLSGYDLTTPETLSEDRGDAGLHHR